VALGCHRPQERELVLLSSPSSTSRAAAPCRWPLALHRPAYVVPRTEPSFGGIDLFGFSLAEKKNCSFGQAQSLVFALE
jgi:hypothetical protein